MQPIGLAERINNRIGNIRSKQFARLSNANSKELWAAVKGRHNNNLASQYGHILTSPDSVNKFFATVATDDDYDASVVVNLRNDVSLNDLESVSCFTEMDVEPLLRKLKNTAPGYDNIPSWVFRCCSYELAGIVAFIINYSFQTGTVPSTWLTAIVTPVPKVTNPKSISDFRPISVTPILSRLTEKLLVRKWLRPALPTGDLIDQYAFKPTGSTECALINCLDCVTRMLDSNEYVRCMLVDFSKAFDTVNHVIIIKKLNLLDIPPSIKNWVIAFLTRRSQITKISYSFSSMLVINRSIVQGSGVGPYLYLLLESDLHPLSVQNLIFKYADDTNLLVPQHSDFSMVDEFNHIQDWARQNKMIINYTKTKEIVFHKPHPSKYALAPSFQNIEIIHDAKLLGVILSDNLSFEKHVCSLLACCSQRFYLLKLLRDGGMSPNNLNTVFRLLLLIESCIVLLPGEVF
jgi:hypothetical protein